MYTAEDNIDAAVYFLAAVENSIETLARHSLIGSARHFENTKLRGMRTWRVKGYEDYLIFYTVENATIKIFRFFNARRDFSALLDL